MQMFAEATLVKPHAQVHGPMTGSSISLSHTPQRSGSVVAVEAASGVLHGLSSDERCDGDLHATAAAAAAAFKLLVDPPLLLCKDARRLDGCARWRPRRPRLPESDAGLRRRQSTMELKKQGEKRSATRIGHTGDITRNKEERNADENQSADDSRATRGGAAQQGPCVQPTSLRGPSL